LEEVEVDLEEVALHLDHVVPIHHHVVFHGFGERHVLFLLYLFWDIPQLALGLVEQILVVVEVGIDMVQRYTVQVHIAALVKVPLDQLRVEPVVVDMQMLSEGVVIVP
jgi:hypothetical protein